MGYYDHGPLVQLERPVAIIGFLGSEAPAVAQLCASLAGLSYLEIDRLVEHEVGCSRAAYARARGLEALRAEESAALGRALRDRPVGVLGLGDAALLPDTDRARVLAQTDLVYIERPWEMLLGRLRERAGRLADEEPGLAANPDFHLARLEQLFLEREPGYLAAPRRVAGDDRHPNEIARGLVKDLGWAFEAD